MTYKQKVRRIRAGFRRWFVENYKGCFKTSWHFFRFVSMTGTDLDEARLRSLMRRFTDACIRNRTFRSVEGAMDWFFTQEKEVENVRCEG